MKHVNANEIIRRITELAREANFALPENLTRLIDRAVEREEKPIAKQALSAILANIRLAKKLPLPLCQDTGLVEVFLEIGSEIKVDLKPFSCLEEVASEGVAAAYQKYFLRLSVVDPLTRENTGNNAPAVVHVRLVSGKKIKIRLMVKGFGSENMGKVINLPPGSGRSEVEDFVVKCMEEAGSRPCPPVFIGIGIGGTMEKAALLAKEALLCPEELTTPNKDKELRALEQNVLRRVNKSGIGPAGLGGKTTALAVKAKKFPTHIAGLPVAVNISCWALRVSRGEI
ncbi:MAG: fumarate hydratase [Candidatus Omnitrophota bacterium]